MIRRMNDLNIQQNPDDQFQTQQKVKQTIISKNSPKNLFDRSIHYPTLSSMKSGSRIFKNFNPYEFVYKSSQKRQFFQPFSSQDARKFENARKFDETRKFDEARKFDETRKFERYSIYSFFDPDLNPNLDKNDPDFRKYSDDSELAQYSRELIQLNKCYKDAEKFTSKNDNFEFKSSIFEKKCKRVDLSSDAYMLEVSIMLIESTFNFYYSHRKSASEMIIMYTDFCTKIQNFFEDLE